MKYNVPAQEVDDFDSPVAEGGKRKKKKEQPCVRIPISKEIAQALSVGGKASIEVVGTVKGIQVIEPEKRWDRTEIELYVDSIEVEGDNEFTKMAEDHDKGRV